MYIVDFPTRLLHPVMEDHAVRGVEVDEGLIGLVELSEVRRVLFRVMAYHELVEAKDLKRNHVEKAPFFREIIHYEVRAHTHGKRFDRISVIKRIDVADDLHPAFPGEIGENSHQIRMHVFPVFGFDEQGPLIDAIDQGEIRADGAQANRIRETLGIEVPFEIEAGLDAAFLAAAAYFEQKQITVRGILGDFPFGHLFLVKTFVVLLRPEGDRVMTGIIGLDEGRSLLLPPAASADRLGDELEGPFRGPKGREGKPDVG